jgi:cytochrome bd ubiquinol oxidase subunit II
MHLYEVPLWFALVGLALYTVLGGADFGAGFWQLVAGSGKQADEVRDEAHHAMAPVWEANHVWLIFILTVVWTAYPAAFGSIASTFHRRRRDRHARGCLRPACGNQECR